MSNRTIPQQRTSTSKTEARSRGRGKWQQPGVPHKGWHCVEVTDLGDDRTTCEMCECVEIRHVYHMSHPRHPGSLGVGSFCAENMEKEYQTPKANESRRQFDFSMQTR